MCVSSSPKMNVTFIGVHARRTDSTRLETYDETFFLRAIGIIIAGLHFPPSTCLLFIVVSDDMNWTRQKFESALFLASEYITDSPTRAAAVYSEGHNRPEDLAILASCNHSVITIGTFGWWSAYLAGGLTVYNGHYPPENNSLVDYYPPSWIGLF